MNSLEPEELVPGPVTFTHACGHRGVLTCLETTARQVTFLSQTLCDACTDQDQLGSSVAPLTFDVPGVLETASDLEDQWDQSLDAVTHLHCADCGQLYPIEELALRVDNRRSCTTCVETAQRLTEARICLETNGQQTLF